MTLCGNDGSTSIDDSLAHVARCFAPVICPIDTDTVDAKDGRVSLFLIF
jgi:hypothetical protein